MRKTESKFVTHSVRSGKTRSNDGPRLPGHLLVSGKALGVVGDDLAENFVEADGDGPVGIVGIEFGEIGDVADVIAFAILIDILPIELFAADLLDFGDGFQHGDTVLAPAAHVVDLTGSGIGGKFFDGANDVVAVDVVANLLGFIAEHGVGGTSERHFHEIRKKSVEFDAGVRRAGKTAAAEDADVHAEVAAVFLGHEIGGGFRSAEERVKSAINAAIFVDALEIFGAGVIPARFEFF